MKPFWTVLGVVGAALPDIVLIFFRCKAPQWDAEFKHGD